MSVNHWMSWEGGVDLVAFTNPDLDAPNVIIHVARIVHTPQGSAPAGMILWQPDPSQTPVIAGFVSSNPQVGAYFGPHIFAGTPFEHAPTLDAAIDITHTADSASAKVSVADHTFEVSFSGLQSIQRINRDPIPSAPFSQQVLERIPSSVTLTVNGSTIDLIIPEVGISGGAAAVFASAGTYSR